MSWLPSKMATIIHALAPLLLATVIPHQVAYARASNDAAAAVPYASFSEAYPHQATVLMYRNPWDIRLCGGSLVAPQWVLTSAACINKCGSPNNTRGADDNEQCNDFFRVVLGAQYLRAEESHQESLAVAEVVVHPEYAGDVRSDMALLKLDKSATLSEYIQPISLPSADVNVVNLTKSLLSVSGWCSASGDSSQSLTATHTTVKTSFFGKLFCKAAFAFHPLKSYHICARQDTCVVDRGGSPLVAHVPAASKTGTTPVLVQVGVSSGAVHKQCSSVLPALFLRLDPVFVAWVREVTG